MSYFMELQVLENFDQSVSLSGIVEAVNEKNIILKFKTILVFYIQPLKCLTIWGVQFSDDFIGEWKLNNLLKFTYY